jgi:hypothetical protein
VGEPPGNRRHREPEQPRRGHHRTRGVHPQPYDASGEDQAERQEHPGAEVVHTERYQKRDP